MTEKKNSMLLKVALAIFAIAYTTYGIILLFFTNSYIESTGSEIINPNWIRWAGGVLLALAYGTLRVFRNPVHQDTYVIVAALATLFTGLALAYELIFEMEAGYIVWMTVLPCAGALVISALLWIGRQQAKDILKQG
ncbi:MAG: hypothetical protein ABFS28_12285 [Bacteroidota bacterium]